MIERKRKGIDLCSWYLHLAAWRRSWEIVCQRRDSGRQGESDIRSRMGQGKLRSYLLPPGAVGGRYGSGCFHCLRSSSVWSKRIYPREKEERVSESCFQESDGVVVTGLTESRGGGGRVVTERGNSLSVVSARGRCCWLRRESECTRPGRARGDDGRTSRGPA